MSVMFLAAGALDQARETAETFGFDWKIFFSQVISFIIVAWVLRQFAYKPILAVLEDRTPREHRDLAHGETNADAGGQQFAVEAEAVAAQMRHNTLRRGSAHPFETSLRVGLLQRQQQPHHARKDLALEVPAISVAL